MSILRQVMRQKCVHLSSSSLGLITWLVLLFDRQNILRLKNEKSLVFPTNNLRERKSLRSNSCLQADSIHRLQSPFLLEFEIMPLHQAKRPRLDST